MRILSLRFQNINSLAGEWEVDFTDPAYESEGIFTITGPTGSGKTSLLDVICLALYGRTPRLERVNRTSNDIMTRQTGECFAEVCFSTQAGRFRSHWSQRRAHKKPGGELQTPRHEISNADTGLIIDNQIRTVAQRIEQITGMDFSRFTQSMLLAQGGFTAFLKASADERAPILEQITGTGIYSVISIKVHERHRAEQEQLQQLTAELNGMQLLSDEEETQLSAVVQQQTLQLDAQVAELNRRREQREWKLQCTQLEQKIPLLEQQQHDWQRRDKLFQPSRERLQAAGRALELAAAFELLLAQRRAQLKDQQRLADTAAATPALQQQQQQQQLLCEQGQQQRSHAEQTLRSMRPVLRQVQQLDMTLVQHQRTSETTRQDVNQRAEQLRDCQRKQERLFEDLTTKRTALNQSADSPADSDEQILQGADQQCSALEHHRAEQQKQLSTLSQGYSLTEWRQRSDGLLRKTALLDKLDSRFQLQQDLQARLTARQQTRSGIHTELQHSQERRQSEAQLVEAHQNTLDALRAQLLQQKTIQDLESLRSRLVTGEPCSLCGSVDHPFALHAPKPMLDAVHTALDETAAKLKASEQLLAAHTHRSLQLEADHRHLLAQDQADTVTLEKNALEIEQLCAQLELTAGQGTESLRARLDADYQTIQDLLARLEEGQRSLQTVEQSLQAAYSARNNLQMLMQEINNLQLNLDELQAQSSQLQTQHTAQQKQLELQQAQLHSLRQQRRKLLAELDPDAEERRLETALTDAETRAAAQERKLQHSKDLLRDNQQSLSNLQQEIDLRARQIQQSENSFVQALAQQNFLNEQQFLAARLPDNEKRALEHQSAQLMQEGIELTAQLKQTRESLSALQTKAISTSTLEQLQQSVDEQDQRVSELQQTLGATRNTLKQNQQLRERQQQQIERIDLQKKQAQHWAMLHELIGSSDGKKFRNFAQGLTFELMINHANVQLQRMSDRYLLIRDLQQPLDLNVIDQYQAGEIRSTRNLSGGESFIVSLALALGLSRMASRNVRVDSLFLDEGFGTLDEDALDVALDTLGNLQQEGKMIGVISHVSALKDRITTRIKVTPGPGGHSRISGPGCRAL